MDTSVGDQTNININSDNSSPSEQKFLQKIKGVFGFFTLSKDEMIQAGIDISDNHESYEQ
ncbi:MAG: hypothetical protein MUO40_12435 [Anaerolineaceae bacterium]|nr:hypothetical protein [Anaerolineaceae bacterium]